MNIILTIGVILSGIFFVSNSIALTMDELKKAAQLGNTEAQIRLGEHYETGVGVPQDFIEAARWYIKAMINRSDNSREAEARLEAIYKDAVAVEKMRQAAIKGDADAQYVRGKMYQSGVGEKYDIKEAKKWYLRAAEQGHPEALYRIAMSYMTDPSLSKDQKDKESAKWMLKAAEHSHPFGQGMLGIMYLHGEGVPRDSTEAVRWLTKSAEQGIASAQGMLGDIFAYGRGGASIDVAAAYKWYTISAANGYDTDRVETLLPELAKKLSNEDVMKAKKTADAWLIKYEIKRTLTK